jgi:hypothetical protein
MSTVVISLFFALGVSAWLYTKLQKYSGNNTKQTLTVLGFAALVLFFITWSILNLIFK